MAGLPPIKYTNYDFITALGTKNDWNNIVPQQSRSDYEANGLAIAREDYIPQWNNVVDTIMNKIGKTVIQQATMSNPLSAFMTGDFGMTGDTIEQIYIGLIKASQYKPDFEEGSPYKTVKSNIETMFHRNPRREVFQATIYRDDLAKAFRTEYGLATLVNGIIGSISQSNTAAQFVWTKKTFHEYLTRPTVPLRPLQQREVALPIDTATGNQFMKALQKAILDLQFNNTNYNPKEVPAFNAANDLALFVHKDIMPVLNVDTFSGAFNIGNVTVNVPIIPLDNFGGETNCLAILCDREWFMLMNQMQTTQSIFNPEKLYTNIFYHIWEQYSVSYFHNFIAFMSNTAVPFAATGMEEFEA